MLKKFLAYRLELIAFTTGAATMILEIVGSRLLAPFIGTSIIAWSTLIGVILSSLALGYFFGGKWADNEPNYRTLSKILIIAALSMVLMIIVHPWILGAFLSTVSDLRMRSLVSSTALFFVPSIFLGMVTPYAVRLKLEKIASSGATVGKLYALSTLGSIVGTFMAGFILIPAFGTKNILITLVGILVLLGLIAFPERKLGEKISAFFLFLFVLIFLKLFPAKFLKADAIDVDTPYNRVLIYDAKNTKNQRPTRYLIMNNMYFQPTSAMYLENDELVFDYLKFFYVARHFQPQFKSALMIGGAAYSFPRDFLATYPEATMHVVEIDPTITELARRYFRFKDDPRLTIYHEDGRTFLNTTSRKYDLIFIDAFSSFYSIPFQLTTKEAIEKKYRALNPEGMVLVNIISSLEGEGAKFLQAEYKTYAAIFPHVYLFPVESRTDTAQVQNIILVALKSNKKPELERSADPLLQEYLSHLYQPDIPSKTPLLTDNFAPVDNFIIKLLP